MGSTLERLAGAAMRGLGRRGSGANRGQAKGAADKLEKVGAAAIGMHSSDEDLENWESKLWHEQDELIYEREREWRQHMHYCANEQLIAYHKERRVWIPRRAVPWRIRAIYNIVQKAVNIRVSRLTENKPTVSVQAATGELADIEKAEYKQSLFWYLWEELSLHMKVVRARRWATKCGTGYLKVGWDADAGCTYPVTNKQPRIETVMVPATDPQTGQPIPGAPPEPQQVQTGYDEFYLDAQGQSIGPVETLETDPETGQKHRVRQPQPENADTYSDGQAVADVVSPFALRYDRYVDDPWDSWYVQHAAILTASKILAAIPDFDSKLQEAELATELDKTVQWSGLKPMSLGANTAFMTRRAGESSDPTSDTTPIDKEYLVRETWIFPKDKFLQKQWGKKGALIITVGGKLAKKLELPEWAIHACPFVQFIDIPEEGNHYGKSSLRDLIPIQDDINRSRSMMAERAMLLSRLLLGAPQGHGINFKLMAGMPGVLVTYRSAQHVPQPLSLGTPQPETQGFYETSLAAAQDVGNMNDASTGKIPSAGVAAKTVYALQYADERSISETSTLQDLALKRLAQALDWVTRVEYQESRKIRIIGADQSFLAEREIRPEHLDSDVDYFFTPGSMLSRSKEAVKNELITLRDEGLLDDATVKKNLAAAVPEAYRQSYNQQEAKARRMVDQIVNGDPGEPPQLQPMPWDDPAVARAVIEEFTLSAKWDSATEQQKAALTQLWQAYALMQMQQAQPAPSPGQEPNGRPGAPGAAAPANQPGAGAQPTKGAQAMEDAATAAQERGGPPGEAPQKQ